LSCDATLKLDFFVNFIGLGAFLYTDIFIRVVRIWELGRTRDTGTNETIVPTKMVCLRLTPTLWT